LVADLHTLLPRASSFSVYIKFQIKKTTCEVQATSFGER